MFFIKPEGLEHKNEILKCIEDAGLAISDLREVTMTETVIAALYGHVQGKILLNIRSQMLGKTCLAGIVSGENAIARLVAIVGDHSHACCCAKTTIRFKFGDHREKCQHMNGIHRPRTAEEVSNHLKLLGYDN